MRLTPKTARRIARAGDAGAEAGRALPAGNDRPFEPYLWRRWTAGCRNARLLWEDAHTRGGWHRRCWRPRPATACRGGHGPPVAADAATGAG